MGNKIVAVISNPTQFRIPSWYLIRQRDYKDGKTLQLFANTVDTKLREDVERMKSASPPRFAPLLVRQGARAAHRHLRPPRRYGRGEGQGWGEVSRLCSSSVYT